MTKFDRRQHVEELADKLGVQVRYLPAFRHRDAHAGPGFIRVAPPETSELYYSALHELGHHAQGHAHQYAHHPALRRQRLDLEAEAWDWAIENAREPVTPPVALRARDALDSYLRAAYGRYPLFGPPGVKFWDTFFRFEQQATPAQALAA